MNPRADQESTSSEVQEAKSLIARLNTNSCNGYGNHHDKKESDSVDRTHGVCHPVDDLLNKGYGVSEEQETTFKGKDSMSSYPLEDMGVMEMEDEAPKVAENTVEVLENKMIVHRPVVAPHPRRFWTMEEHRLFLRGLQIYGRGQWKNISKYFVTTRTPIQVSSHAQKYFKRLEVRESGKQRYSINDVRLHDADLWTVESSSSARSSEGGRKLSDGNGGGS